MILVLQHAELILSSTDYSDKRVRLVTKKWQKAAGNSSENGWFEENEDQKDSMQAVKFDYYNDNTEWNLFAYKIETSTRHDPVGQANYSTVYFRFGFERNASYYDLTLLIPIIALTLLAPIGLIIPGTKRF